MQVARAPCSGASISERFPFQEHSNSVYPPGSNLKNEQHETTQTLYILCCISSTSEYCFVQEGLCQPECSHFGSGIFITAGTYGCGHWLAACVHGRQVQFPVQQDHAGWTAHQATGGAEPGKHVRVPVGAGSWRR